MKVLYDHQVYVAQKFGGISRYFNELMKADIGDWAIDRIDPEISNEGFNTRKPNLFIRAANAASRRIGIEPPAKPKKTAIAVTNILNSGNYDLFHPTYYQPYFLDYVRKPFVLTVYDMIHEVYSECFQPDDPTTRNKMLLCDKAVHIIAISEKTKSDLVQIYGIPESKITTILLASGFNTATSRQPENMPDVKKYILYTGTRYNYKNFFFSMVALSELLKNDKDLNILCSGTAFTSGEMQFFRNYGIENQMHHIYLKTDAELVWMYSNAELFIFPSLYEGFGFPLLEAFACKCPVISSTGGSLPEVADDAAIFFDPKNYIQIRDAAASVLYNKETKQALILKGLQRLKNFSWDKCRRETYEVYKAVLR